MRSQRRAWTSKALIRHIYKPWSTLHNGRSNGHMPGCTFFVPHTGCGGNHVCVSFKKREVWRQSAKFLLKKFKALPNPTKIPATLTNSFLFLATFYLPPHRQLPFPQSSAYRTRATARIKAFRQRFWLLFQSTIFIALPLSRLLARWSLELMVRVRKWKLLKKESSTKSHKKQP